MSNNKCPECNSELYYPFYCKPCNSNHFRDNFPNWTSGDDNIDKLIRESQLSADSEYKLLEWIDYSNFKDIQHIAEGGFASVYKAIWKDGLITNKWDKNNKKYWWDMQTSKWIREGETKVAIKKCRNGTSVSSEILNEVNKLKID